MYHSKYAFVYYYYYFFTSHHTVWHIIGCIKPRRPEGFFGGEIAPPTGLDKKAQVCTRLITIKLIVKLLYKYFFVLHILWVHILCEIHAYTNVYLITFFTCCIVYVNIVFIFHTLYSYILTKRLLKLGTLEKKQSIIMSK